MRVLLCFFLCLGIAGATLAITVTSTFPPPGSESFTTRDTLTVVFDQAPPSDVTISIQGTAAAYRVAQRELRGDTLRVTPDHYWMVGDHIVVSVTGSSVTSYVFAFTVSVPVSSDPHFLQRGELSYGFFPRAIAGVDVDNDGLTDLAILFNDHLGVARNLGVAPFFDPATLSWDDGGHTPCDAPRVLRAADLDGDGLPELVISDPIRNTLTIYPNQSGGGSIRFGTPRRISLVLSGPSDFKIADMNGDGLPDIVAIGRTFDPNVSRLIVLVNRGNYLFEAPVWSVGLDPSMLDIADFNLDGRLDVAVSCRGDKSVDILTNVGLDPLSLHRTTVLDSLPAGPDGIIADNVYPCWDNGTVQTPDLVVWSRGVHSANQRGGNRVLDEDPFIYRYCNSGNSSFSDSISLPPSGFPLNITLGVFDSTTSNPGKDWVVLEQSSTGNAVVHLYDDRLNFITQLGTLTDPASPLLFDVNLSGSLDFFFIDYGTGAMGDERIVLLYDLPVTQASLLDFGVAPITGVLKPLTYPYTNRSAYPRTITGVDIPLSDNVFSFLSPGFPDTLAPGATINLVYGFTPLDSNWYGSRASRIHFAGGSGEAFDTLMLHGIGGRSVLESVPRSGQVSTVNVDFGTLEPASADTVSFHLANPGNFPLNVAYNASPLNRFALLNPLIDSVQEYGTSADSVRVRFAAPPQEGTYHECFTIYDSTFFQSDWFGPRNRLVRDTIFYCFQARVLRKSLPIFVFPDVAPFEGGADTFRIHVYDPNNLAGQDSIRVQYLGVVTQGCYLSTIPESFEAAWRDTAFSLEYRVAHDVPPPGQTCALAFRAWDVQFPDRFVDTTWTVHINYVDDPPQIFPHDTTFQAVEGEWLNATLRVSDQEHDILAFQSAGKPDGAVDTLDMSSGLYSLVWRPDFSAAGTYVMRVVVFERVRPWLRDSARVTITVQDVAPDLEVTDLHADPTEVNRGGSTTIHFTFHERYNIPVQSPFTVQLKDSIPGAVFTRVSRQYSSLLPGESVSDVYQTTLTACGTHAFVLQIIPTGPDRDNTNNSRTISVPVRCADLAAGPIVVVSHLHKHDRTAVQVSVEERNGIAVDTTISATLRVYAAGGVQQMGTFTYSSIPANGRISESVPWEPDTCFDHRFEFVIDVPPGWDATPSNNTAERNVLILCDPFQVYPLPFTPNADGFNDTLYFAFGDERYRSPEVNIFSLDGRLVASLAEVSNNMIFWLGRDRYGKDCAPGAYLYTFQDGSQKVKSGIIYVAR